MRGHRRLWRNAAAALLFTAAYACHADFQTGLLAFERGDFRTALRQWKPLAEAGEPEAQNNLAVLYDRGLGVSRSLRKALKWYRKAAEQGNAEAQYSVGLMLSRGEGTREDERAASVWFRRAADAGLVQAQFHLALVYDFGSGVDEDNLKAMKWYRRAANQGHAAAQYNLAQIYDFGEGVREDDVQAVEWYKRAAVQGDAKAQYMLGVSYFIGEGLAKDIIAAYAWMTLAATQRDVRALRSRVHVWQALTPQQREKAKALRTELAEEVALRQGLARLGEFLFVPTTGNLVPDLQMVLAALGYTPGPPDGVLGPRTREAIKAFQRDAGLEVTGEATAALLAAMQATPASVQRFFGGVPDR